MSAAIFAARAGASVTLLEPNERLGKKLNITGKGRCNVTNQSGCNELIAHVIRNGKFLYSSFSKLDGFAAMSFFEELGVPLKVERGKRVFPVLAYLTFDDGPYYNTYTVLKILKQNKVKATFFTTNTNGEHCYDNKSANCHEVYKAIANDNHTIANHTYTHGWNRGLYNNVNSFMDAVKKQEELIKEKTGITTNILRFPGGSSTPGATRGKAMKQALYEAGYGWVDWTAGDGDGGSLPNYTTGWNNLMKTIGEKIEVVLFHDYHKVTTSLLTDFIKYLREHNYIVLPLFYESVMINKK